MLGLVGNKAPNAALCPGRGCASQAIGECNI